MKASEWAHGKWPTIISALIGPEYVDRKHHPCPKGDGTDRFRFADINGKGNFFCRCSDGDKDGFDLIQCCRNTDFAGAAKLVEEVIGQRDRDDYPQARKKTYAEKLLAEAVKSPRSKYLENRGLNMPPGLLWHPSVDYRGKNQVIAQYPAMVAPLTREGRFLTCHITYLKDGSKAPVDSCRKILPGPCRNNGAAVELYPAEPTIGIAEGIETAIAAQMLYGIPTWAALSAALLKAFTPPSSVRRLVIFGDNDRNHTGQAAAHALASRLHGRFEIDVKFPSQIGHDFNDVLLERKLVA